MSHRRSTVKGSLSFANPTVRAWLFQILAVVAVVGIVGWLFHNTVTNLNNRGITSGFAFLDRGAGFGIVQHLIDYQQGDTYGRVFIVGLLNTLLVSALCIVFASVLGFFIGLARLSDNWLLRKLSTIYIEIFRNIPPLLQIFFWYFAVLRNLPGPRQAVSAFDLAFLSNRGLYIPSPQLGDGFIAFILAVVMAIVLSVGLNTIIALFKDTSLVIIIGLFDLFSSVQQATVDPTWLGMSTEGYVFAALIYWIFCFSMSRYSQHLEKRFNTGRTPH